MGTSTRWSRAAGRGLAMTGSVGPGAMAGKAAGHKEGLAGGPHDDGGGRP